MANNLPSVVNELTNKINFPLKFNGTISVIPVIDNGIMNEY